MDLVNRCCLIDNNEKCERVAGNAAYNKRIQRNVAQKKLKLHIDAGSSHNYICEYHKQIIQTVRKRKRHDSDDENCLDGQNHHDPSCDGDCSLNELDLHPLQMNTLRRFKRHYKIQTKPGLTKPQMADYLQKQFHLIPVAEKECLGYFIYMIKEKKSKFDQRPNNSHNTSGGAGSATEDI